MGDGCRLVGSDSQVTTTVRASYSCNLHREHFIGVALGNGISDIAIVGIVAEVNRTMTTMNAVAAPGSREGNILVATRILTAIDGVKQLYSGTGGHLEGVTVHVLGRSLVGPVSTELCQVDSSLVGWQHIGNIGLKNSRSVKGDGLVLCPRVAQRDGCGVGAAGSGCIGHSDDLASFLLTDGYAACIHREHARLVVKRQGDGTCKFIPLNGEGCRGGLFHIGIHIQFGCIYLDARPLDGWLDTHNHLLLDVKGHTPR